MTLTPAQKQQIRTLTKSGTLQCEIAQRLHIGRDCVGRWQMRMGLRGPWKGLPTRPKSAAVPEEQILELFKQGWGGYKIAKFLHVSVPKVYAVAHKHGISNGWAKTPAENEALFIEAVKNREDYIIKLARKYKVGICRAKRLAHQILRTVRFRPGASKPPLDSVFPQRHFRKSGRKVKSA